MNKFNKESGMIPIIGTMACESVLRQKEWLRAGCNAFDNKEPNSKPLSFWTEQDILRYLKEYELPYPAVYGEILIDDNGKYYTLVVIGRDAFFVGTDVISSMINDLRG